MEIFATYINSMTGYVNSVQSNLGRLVTVLLTLEIIWVGIETLKGKYQDANSYIWKTLSVLGTLILCANITIIADVFINGLLNISGKIFGLSNISVSNPIKAGWDTMFSFWNGVFDSLEKLFKVRIDEKTINPYYFHVKILGWERFFPTLPLFIIGAVFILVGAFLSLVLIYGYIIFYIAVIEYKLVLLMASIFILFTIWQPTKFLAQNVLSTIWANIIKLFTLNFIILLAVQTMKLKIMGDLNNTSGFLNAQYKIDLSSFFSLIVECLILGFCFYLLIKNAPQIANGFLSGQTSLNTVSFSKFLGAAVAGGITTAALGKGSLKTSGGVLGSIVSAFSDSKTLTSSRTKALGEALSSGAKTLGRQTLKGMKTISAAAMTGSLGGYNRMMWQSLGGSMKDSFGQGKSEGAENYYNRTHNKQGELNRRGEKHVEMGIKNAMKRGGSV